MIPGTSIDPSSGCSLTWPGCVMLDVIVVWWLTGLTLPHSRTCCAALITSSSDSTASLMTQTVRRHRKVGQRWSFSVFFLVILCRPICKSTPYYIRNGWNYELPPIWQVHSQGPSEQKPTNPPCQTNGVFWLHLLFKHCFHVIVCHMLLLVTFVTCQCIWTII